MKHRRSYVLAIFVLGLLVGWGTPNVAAQLPDPGVMGPRQVARAEYDFGLTAFTPTGFPGPVELLASVHYPQDLSGGPFPLVIFLHGAHFPCFSGTTGINEWPCSLSSPIPSYMGFDYAAAQLASHGFIVVSISANGINAVDNGTSDRGALARAELIQRHLDIWNTFNTTGGAPFCNRFVGKVDLQRVGTMGHSRGGEGVVRHFQLNQALGSPYGIKAVFALAPTDFNRPVINRVPLAALLPYCDGDVFDLQGVHFYDDARYNVPGDTAAKHTILVMGGNHNFYNTVWTPVSEGGGFVAATADDWGFLPGAASDPHCRAGGLGRLSASQQQGTAKAYLSAFFRTYLKNETQFLPLLTSAAPPPASAMTNNIHVSYHAPDTPTMRRDINRLLNGTNLSINTLGGAVTQTGLSPYDLCGGADPQPPFCTPLPLPPPPRDIFRSHEPHVTPSALSPGTRGLSQLRFGWNNSAARYENAIPITASNLFGLGTLQFRASVNVADMRNPVGLPQNLSVELVDGTGAVSSAVRVSDHSSALFYPPGQTTGFQPRLVQNTVHVPLTAFTGVNMGDIRSVRFRFDQQGSGALLMSDLSFVATPGVPAPTPTPTPTPQRCDVTVSPNPLVLISFGFNLDSGIMTAQTGPFPCVFVLDQPLLEPPISAFPLTDLFLPFDQWFVFDDGGPIPFSPFTAFGTIGFLAFNGQDFTAKQGTIILTVFGGGPLLNEGPVIDVPVTGEYATTRMLPQADGTTSTQTTTSLFFRDRQGRIRQERGDVVTITDPVAGASYILDPKEKTAHRSIIKKGDRNAAPGNPPTIGGPNTTSLSESRSLGTQRMDGVEAAGQEYISVIPAGSKLGNSDPVQMTYQVWRSEKLQLPLLVRIQDALNGDTSIRFRILQKGAEPDPKLFAVPEGYRVVDAIPVGRRGQP
jgi:hypothetical protein